MIRNRRQKLVITSTGDLFGLISSNFRTDLNDNLFSPELAFTAKEENVNPRLVTLKRSQGA